MTPQPELRRTTVWQKYRGGHHPYALLCATLPMSRPMVFNGQEIGYQRPISHDKRRRDIIRWGRSPRLQDFYRRLLWAYRRNPALWRGDFRRLASGAGTRVYAFSRERDKNHAIVAVNLSEQPAEFAIRENRLRGEYTERFTDKTVLLDGQLTWRLPPWGYLLLTSVGETKQDTP